MLTANASSVLINLKAHLTAITDEFDERDARSLMRACELLHVSVSITGDDIAEDEGVQDAHAYTLSDLDVLDGLREFIGEQHELTVHSGAELESGKRTSLRVVVPRDELKRLSERAEDLHTGAHTQAGHEGHESNPWRESFEKLKADLHATVKALK